MAQILAKLRDDKAFLHTLFQRDDISFVQALWWIFFEEEPAFDEREVYLSRLRSGYGRASLIAEIAGSGRSKKANSLSPLLAPVVERRCHPLIWEELRGLENRAFVRLAYRTLLGRDPEAGEFQTWFDALENGCKRQEVLRNLRGSPEGRARRTETPELDRVIRGKRMVGVFPFLRRLGSPSRAAMSKRAIRESLGRIESGLFEFRSSRLGARLATAFAEQEDGVALERDRKLLADFLAPELASTKVTGNVALAARAWAGNVAVQRILILKLDHIGDFYVGIRAMVMLREAWPNAHITLVCGPWNVGLARQLGIFDRIVAYRFFNSSSDRESFDGAKRSDDFRDLGLETYDLAIDLRHDHDTRPLLARVDSKMRAGFASPETALRSTALDLFLMEVPGEFRDQLHAETRLVALSSLVIETLQPPAEHPIRRLISAEHSPATRPFTGRPFMVVAPGAGSPIRTWPAENFVALMRKALDAWKIGLVLIGSASEMEINNTIAAQFDPDDLVNLTGGGLTDLATLVDGATLFVGNDSGSGHVAALLGRPTLSIYAGVSDPRVWQPLGARVSIVHSRTPCSYCHINLRSDCRHELRCLSEITVEMAWAELEHLHSRYASPYSVSASGSEGEQLDTFK